MASPLKVTHLDSPLRRSDRAPVEESIHSATPRDLEIASESPEIAATAPTAAAPAAAGSTKPRRRRAAAPRVALTDDGRAALQDLWSPPALDERVELVSTRLPVSLARALERHTRALRDRHDVGSQKALPMQEVLAAVIWALGDPDTDAAVERLDTIYRSYRSRRMAAAARALEPH